MQESEGIFLWCLEGLYRLLANNYRFTISGQAKENVETVKRSSNNVIEFLQSEGYIRFKADCEASSSVSNLSNKLQRESLRYTEAVQLAEVLGYEIVWQKRGDR